MSSHPRRSPSPPPNFFHRTFAAVGTAVEALISPASARRPTGDDLAPDPRLRQFSTNELLRLRAQLDAAIASQSNSANPPISDNTATVPRQVAVNLRDDHSPRTNSAIFRRSPLTPSDIEFNNAMRTTTESIEQPSVRPNVSEVIDMFPEPPISPVPVSTQPPQVLYDSSNIANDPRFQSISGIPRVGSSPPHINRPSTTATAHVPSTSTTATAHDVPLHHHPSSSGPHPLPHALQPTAPSFHPTSHPASPIQSNIPASSSPAIPPTLPSTHHHAAALPSAPPSTSPRRLALRASPRASDDFTRRRVVVSRHDRGSTAKDIQKTKSVATRAIAPEYLLDYLPTDYLLDPSNASLKLANYYLNYNAGIKAIMDRITDFDMDASIEVFEYFDITTGDHGGRTYNLYREGELLPVEKVLAWQSFYQTWSTSLDKQSDDWVYDFHLNCLKPALREELLQELSELPPDQQGGAALIRLTIAKLRSNSYELSLILQKIITEFSIKKYAQEDVTLAGRHLKAIGKTLLLTDDLPPRSTMFVLHGMSASSDSHFNGLVSSLAVGEEFNYAPPAPGQRYSSVIYKKLVSILDKLSKYHLMSVQSGKWPALLSSTAPTRPQIHHTTTSSDVDALATALVNKLNTASSPKGPSASRPCLNCGATDHWRDECPKPFGYLRRNRDRSKSPGPSSLRSQPRSDSRSSSRPSSRPSSRSSSRHRHDSRPRGRPYDRNPTPSHRRVASSSRERTKSVTIAPAAHNVSLTGSDVDAPVQGSSPAAHFLRSFGQPKE